MKKFVSAIGFGAVVLLSGCASIVSDKIYSVTISSYPEDASFEVINSEGTAVQRGKTPQTVVLNSGQGYFSSAVYTIKFNKEGFEEKTFILDSSMDGWYIGNLLIGGLIGFLIVDPITGAMWKLPETATVALSEDKSTAAEAPTTEEKSVESDPKEDKAGEDTLSLININQVPLEMRDQLIRIN